MNKLAPTVAKTSEQLARALGHSAAEAKDWAVQHALASV